MITTPRLRLRPWLDRDRAPFAAMGADPEVMRYLGPLQSRAEADGGVDRMMLHQAEHGFCFWAVERLSDGEFLGFCGLKVNLDPSPILNEIEIGWRLRRDAWGQGYAKEAALASLDWGFGPGGLRRIVAITNIANTNSWGLMQRLGMQRRADLDYDHPRLAADNPLRPHIVYEKLAEAA